MKAAFGLLLIALAAILVPACATQASYVAPCYRTHCHAAATATPRATPTPNPTATPTATPAPVLYSDGNPYPAGAEVIYQGHTYRALQLTGTGMRPVGNPLASQWVSWLAYAPVRVVSYQGSYYYAIGGWGNIDFPPATSSSWWAPYSPGYFWELLS